MWIIDDNVEDRSLSSQWNPGVSSKIIETEVFQEVGIDDGSFIIGNVRALIKLTERRPECRFRQAILIEQEGF